MMLFEARKVLLGFRLKITFDVALHREDSYVFVDVAKTPTIGLLLNDITLRFELTHGCYLAVQNCKLLNSESIYVLVDVNSVEMMSPLSENFEIENPVNQKAAIINSESDLFHKHIKNSDEVDGQSPNYNKAKKQEKSFAEENIAATFEKLSEEKEIGSIGDECSATNLWNNIKQNEKTKYCLESVNTNKVDVKSVRDQEMSDLSSDIFGAFDISLDKVKRKRKRKHSKKKEVKQMTENLNPEPENLGDHMSSNVSRQHIYFSDLDEVSDILISESALKATVTTATENKTIIQDTFIADSKTVKDVCLPQSSAVTTDGKLFKQHHCLEIRNCKPQSSLLVSREPVVNRMDNQGVNTETTCINNTVSFTTPTLLPVPNCQTVLPKRNDVERELSTLLLCKQLNTCMQYNVKYINKTDNDYFQKSRFVERNVGNGLNNKDTTVIQSPVSVQQIQKSPCQNSVDLKNLKLELNENCDNQHMEDSSDDCEVLKEVKVYGGRIQIRRSDGTWTILDADVANTELPKLDIPKENQSIVFRLMYVNKNFCPTVSNLLYAQVLRFKEEHNTLAVDIPYEFIKIILDDSWEEGLPETLIPITGSSFEIALSTLIEPKLIS